MSESLLSEEGHAIVEVLVAMDKKVRAMRTAVERLEFELVLLQARE